jgi:pantoate--beta-alanine ligase
LPLEGSGQVGERRLMQVVSSVKSMQRRGLDWRRQGIAVGLVPTMGYLHDGHLSLVKRARKRVGPQGLVVVSIYVNPTQFGPNEDLSRYPRDWERDKRMCQSVGVDYVFAPTDGGMYPGEDGMGPSTTVVEQRLSRGLEGKERPTHFQGVTTVVAKLINIVQPTAVVFGAKDYQQAIVVRRMVRDLNIAVEVLVAPTIREPDGLAMSSRNSYLTPAERGQATVLWQAIQRARRMVRAKRRGVSARALIDATTRFIESRPATRVGYVAFVHPETLVPVDRVTVGVQMALAVRVGNTRLIDNGRL